MNFDLERLQNDIASATADLSPEACTWHPDGKWSVAQILEHLYLTYTATTKGFERCIANGAPLARVPTFRDRIRTFVVTRCGYLPEGRVAPKQATPRGLPREEVCANLIPRLLDMDAVIDQAAQKYGPSTRLLDHPILGPLGAREWCIFHRIHGHHHVKQILRLRDAINSSASRAIS
jgi:hypothetical protein